MELQVGYMKIKDLSVWFGLEPETFSKSSKSAKEKKLKILEAFAEYHFEGRKLYIDKVLIPTYSKAYEIIEKEFENEWGNIKDKNQQTSWQKKSRVDSCRRVGKAIYSKNKEIASQIKDSTCVSYANKVKIKNYGHNFIDDTGLKGSSQFVYVLPDESRMLNEEELAIVKQCKCEAYKDVGEQIVNIDEAYRNGEISLAEAKKYKSEMDTNESYINYLELLMERLGYIPELRTQLIAKQNWHINQ